MEIILIIVGAIIALIGTGGLLFKSRSRAAQPPKQKEVDRYVNEELDRIERERLESLSDSPDVLRARAQRKIDRLRARREAGEESERDDNQQ